AGEAEGGGLVLRGADQARNGAEGEVAGGGDVAAIGDVGRRGEREGGGGAAASAGEARPRETAAAKKARFGIAVLEVGMDAGELVLVTPRSQACLQRNAGIQRGRRRQRAAAT